MTVTTEPPPPQTPAAEAVKLPIAGTGFTVTVGVATIRVAQPVAVVVANTLKVMVAERFPVGKFRVPPLPATALPILELSALFLN